MESPRFRADLVLISVFALATIFFMFLYIRRDFRVDKERQLRKEEIKQTQEFMEECYQLEKKNWKTCRDKLLEMKNFETINP